MTEFNYPVRIRIGSYNAGDPATGEYTDSTFSEAVAALQGSHPADHEGDDYPESYHRRESVYVVATHAETHEVEGDGRRTRTVTYRKGEPVFGLEATIYGRDIKYAGQADAEVSWSSGGSMSPDEAEFRIGLFRLATEIAKAANAEPFCPKCQPALDRYAERAARLAKEDA